MAAEASSAGEGAAGGLWACCKGMFSAIGKVCSCITACIKKMSTRTVSIVLRVVNLGNAAFLAVAAYCAYILAAGSVTRFFLATYIAIFALMLCAFETRFKYTEEPIRKNCGFMFTYTGRAALLIFLGAITFGMIDTSQSNYSSDPNFRVVVGAGVFTLLNAIFNCFIICSHPGFQELSKAAEASFTKAGDDPSKMSDDQVKAYLAQHPELARAALASLQTHTAQPKDLETGGGVQDWGATETKPSSKPKASTGWFGGGSKPTSPPAPAAAAYVPPAMPAEPVKVSVDAGKDNADINPFTAPAPVASKPVTTPPVTRPVISPASTAAVPAPAPAPAPTAPVDEDNPFASDNPFDKGF